MNTALQNAITNYIDSKVKKQNNTAIRGTIKENNKVLVNGRLLDYDSAVDVQFSVNEYVWCIMSDNQSLAVIIGK